VVTDGSDTLYGFAPDGTQFLTINSSSVAPPSPAFSAPMGVAVDASGNLYVADQGSDTIYGFAPDGTQFLTINSSSVAPPSPPLAFPRGVTVDAAGNIYVGDFGSFTVYGFRPDGTQFMSIAGDPTFNPIGVAIDAAGVLYVAEPPAIEAYIDDGATELFVINNASSPPPAPPFSSPWGLASSGFGTLFVADNGGDTVYEFATDQVSFDLTNTAAPGTLEIGQITTFTVTVANAGPCDASDVVVDASLPAGLELVSSAAASGTAYDPVTGDWTIGTLANDNLPLTLEITARATTDGAHTLSAAASTTSVNVGASTADATVTTTPIVVRFAG
jgi:uncharacterized repeat protein (TIGR01451 family)